VSLSGALPQLDPAPSSCSTFTVRVDVEAGRLEVAGQLDHRTAPLVRDAIAVLAAARSEDWVVDVSGLAGRDHDCLRAISSSYRRALRTGHRMRLVGAPPSLQRALTRLRLDHHLLPAEAE
jgi:anti-sigma B factor antagonist